MQPIVLVAMCSNLFLRLFKCSYKVKYYYNAQFHGETTLEVSFFLKL